MCLAIILAGALAGAVPPSLLAGDWHGELKLGLASLPMAVHVQGPANGLSASFDSPDQGAYGTPGTAELNGRHVTIGSSALKATITGELQPGDARIVGIFDQGPAHIPFVLERGALSPRSRPQTPKPPFPYSEVDVAFENPGRAHLEGTLTVPPGAGPFPAVLLITGSGLQDRDETIVGHRPFLIWADALARRGVAVLRVDDRNRGRSTGDTAHATTVDFATDAEAAVRYLRQRREIDPRRIGLVGHSEGGEIAVMVAAHDPSIAFVVMLAGVAEDGQTLILHQKRLIEAASGLPPATVEQSNPVMRTLQDAVIGASSDAEAETRLQTAWQGVLKAQRAAESTPMPAELKTGLLDPWMRWFLAHDPKADFAAMRQPLLAINGTRDLQVPAEENLAAVRAASHGRQGVTTVALPDLNHLLQTAKTGLPDEYARIEETVSPLALKTVGEWIVAQAKPGS